MKKSIWLCLLLVVTLAACKQAEQSPVISSSPQPIDKKADAAKVETPIVAQSKVIGGPNSELALPEGLSFTFPYSVRAQRAAITPKGEARRWIGLEFAEGDVQTISNSIAHSMDAAGFIGAPSITDDNGVVRQIFEKSTYGRILVTVRNSQGQKMTDPAAHGVVWLDLPEAGTPNSSMSK